MIAHLYLPCTLENYEKYFSVLASGTYTDYGIKDYDADVHFLLFSVYATINKLFPQIQVYGYIIIGYNILSLTLFGSVLFYIIRKQFSSSILVITFPVIFLAISSYQIVNLSSTRIVFIACFSLFYLIHNNLIVSKNRNLLLFLIFLFLSLIRIDATLLASIIFLLVSVFLNKIRMQQLIPFIVSFSVFISFNVLLSSSQREDKKVYYYRELDLFDKDNIDYHYITTKDSLYISLLTNYSIMDINHFKMDYINKLMKTKSSGFINSFINLKLFAFTFLYSLTDIYYARWLILLCFALVVISIIYFRSSFKYIALLLILFIFPFLLCFYISVPLRFIEPYYILYITLLSIFLKEKVYFFAILILIILSYNNIKISSEKYKIKASNFLINYNYLLAKSNNNKPIVIESIEMSDFFSPNPLFNLKNTNAIFLNFGFLNSYDCYKSSWEKKCNCNPLSLIEKLEYISRNNIEFILKDEETIIYQKYMKLYWNRVIRFEKIEHVNGQINSYKILF